MASIADRLDRLDRLYRVEQVAEILSLSRGKTWELVAQGKIASIKIGRSRRVAGQAIEEYIARLSKAAE